MRITPVISDLIRRRSRRELQAAKYGISVDPVIAIEIEDLNKAISALKTAQTQLLEKEYVGDRIMAVVRETCEQIGIDVDTLEL